MTKSELVTVLADRMDVSKKRAEEVVNAVFASMAGALLSEQRIEVRGFGSFSIREYAPRIGRNPATKQKVKVEAQKSIHFKVGKELRERVDTTAS